MIHANCLYIFKVSSVKYTFRFVEICKYFKYTTRLKRVEKRIYSYLNIWIGNDTCGMRVGVWKHLIFKIFFFISVLFSVCSHFFLWCCRVIISIFIKMFIQQAVFWCILVLKDVPTRQNIFYLLNEMWKKV